MFTKKSIHMPSFFDIKVSPHTSVPQSHIHVSLCLYHKHMYVHRLIDLQHREPLSRPNIISVLLGISNTTKKLTAKLKKLKQA